MREHIHTVHFHLNLVRGKRFFWKTKNLIIFECEVRINKMSVIDGVIFYEKHELKAYPLQWQWVPLYKNIETTTITSVASLNGNIYHFEFIHFHLENTRPLHQTSDKQRRWLHYHSTFNIQHSTFNIQHWHILIRLIRSLWICNYYFKLLF